MASSLFGDDKPAKQSFKEKAKIKVGNAKFAAQQTKEKAAKKKAAVTEKAKIKTSNAKFYASKEMRSERMKSAREDAAGGPGPFGAHGAYNQMSAAEKKIFKNTPTKPNKVNKVVAKAQVARSRRAMKKAK